MLSFPFAFNPSGAEDINIRNQICMISSKLALATILRIPLHSFQAMPRRTPIPATEQECGSQKRELPSVESYALNNRKCFSLHNWTIRPQCCQVAPYYYWAHLRPVQRVPWPCRERGNQAPSSIYKNGTNAEKQSRGVNWESTKIAIEGACRMDQLGFPFPITYLIHCLSTLLL